MRILVIGDFSGRASRGVTEPLAGRPARVADIDSIDALFGDFDVRIAAGPDGAAVHVEPRELDDLHPEAIYDALPVFAQLRELRRAARDPGTFRQAAAKAGLDLTPAAPAAADPPAEPDSFEGLLGGQRGKAATREAAAVDALVRSAVAGSAVPSADPRQDQLLAIVDAAIARQMRTILHDPAWQSVESAWRGLHTLVTGLELGEDITLHALDASGAELAADAAGGGAALEELLVTKPAGTAGGRPWSLVLCLHRFGAGDAGTARVLAGCAHRAGAPLIAAATGELLGVRTFGAEGDPASWAEPMPGAWRDVAAAPEAAALGLTCPRYLMRLPYGRRTDPVDRFELEELAAEAAGAHGAYLWGSGAVLVGLLLGGAFLGSGWSLRPSGAGEVGDLPVHVIGEGGGTGEMKPCAEVWLSDKAAEQIAGRGFIPLVSVQHRGAVRVGPLRSIANTELACRWG